MKAITFLVCLLISTLITFLTFSILMKDFFYRTKDDKLTSVEFMDETNNTPEYNEQYKNSDNKNDKETSLIQEITPVTTISPIPTLSIQITPTIAPTTKPTINPTPTPKFQIPDFSSEQINNLINSYSGKFGVDPNVIRHVALCESGFNPKAKNWIYGGLFQFSPTTWISWREKMNQDTNTDLRYHAEEAIETATYAISLKKGAMWPNCMP